MSSTPHVTAASLPADYGAPAQLLEWSAVQDGLESAMHYWLAALRGDGRPHVVPVDGVWLDSRMYFGGSPTAVWQTCLRSNGRIAVHLEDALQPTIVEGTAVFEPVNQDMAETLARISSDKYGYAPPAEAYREGVWQLPPSLILAWTKFPDDATRFVFRE